MTTKADDKADDKVDKADKAEAGTLDLTEDGNLNGGVHDLACINAFVVGTVIVEGSGDPQ
jgi:hypothetical protein